MFSNSSQIASLSGRAWGIAIGSVVVCGVPAMLVSAKTVQASFPLLVIVTVASVISRGRSSLCVPQWKGPTVILAALLGFAVASAAWASHPLSALSAALVGAAVAGGAIVVMQVLEAETGANTLHIEEGLWIGLLVGLVYAFTEVASDQSIKISVYNTLGLGPAELEPDRYFTWDDNGRLIGIHPDDLKRNLVPIPLLLWPALFAARSIVSRGLRRLVMVGLPVLGIGAVFLSPSTTCKLALLASAIAFLGARYLPRTTHSLLTLSWLLACLAVVPIVIGLRALELQNADWMQLSAQVRIVIWNEIAHLIPSAPLFGTGADMTYAVQPPLHEAPAADPQWLGFPIPHPHNVYLQTWYELGLIGALLLASFGVALLQRIAAAAVAARPALFAVFSAAAVEIAMSYNAWQIWFLCLFGFIAAMCGLTASRSGPSRPG